MAQWLSYPALTGPFSGQEQFLAASSTSPGAGMVRVSVDALAGGVVPFLGGPFLPLAGGTLTGPLLLAGAPTQLAGAATKQYVDDQIGASIVTNVMSFGATGNGITDDTAAISAAITAAGSGVVWFPVGVYNISSTLTLPGNQRWAGAGKQSAILQWVGGNGVDMVNTAVNSLYSGIADLGFNIVSATSMTMLRLRSSREGTYYKLHFEAGNGSLGNTVLFLDSTSGLGNTAHNSFWHVVGRDCATGVVLQGNLSPNTASTDNTFYHLDVSSTNGVSGWIGIDFRHWCDTNQFYYTRLTLGTLSGTGVIFNSLDPTGTASVYNEIFSGLILDNYSNMPTAATGLDLNASSGIHITGLFIAPVPWGSSGILIDADPVNARSYYISCVNANIGGANVMQVYQQNFGDHPEQALQVPGFARTPGLLGTAQIGNANRLYATPIFIPGPYTLQTLSIYVGLANGVTAWNAHVGLYADSGFHSPHALIANTDTAIPVTQTGTGQFITATLNSGAGVPLIRGLYWAVFLCDDPNAFVLSSGPSGPNDGIFSATMFTLARGPLGGGAIYAPTYAYGALPSPFFSTPVTANTAGDTPVVILGF